MKEDRTWTSHQTKDGRTYYYNKALKKSVWEKPDGFVDSSTKNNKDSSSSSTGSDASTTKKLVWEEIFDKKSKRVYYYCRETKESSWSRPKNAAEIRIRATASTGKSSPTKRQQKRQRQEEEYEFDTRKKRKSVDQEDEELEELEEEQEEEEEEEESFTEEGEEQESEKMVVEDESEDMETKPQDAYSPVMNDATIISDKRGPESPRRKAHHHLLDHENSNQEHDGMDEVYERLENTDAIMEADVMKTIEKFLRLHDASGPELLVQTVAESYRGYAQMSSLMAKWFDSTLLDSTTSEVSNTQDALFVDSITTKSISSTNSSDEIIYNFLKSTIVQRYQPKLMEHVLESDTEPIWLEKMLEDSRWRLMLIGLAEKHKSCGLLNYTIQRISEAGHHKEIASVTSASTYFSVFHGVFTDALQRLETGTMEEVLDDIQSLKKISQQSAYTYMYTQEFLHHYERALARSTYTCSHDGSLLLFRTRRVQQELAQATYQTQKTKVCDFHIWKRKEFVAQYPTLSSCLLQMLVDEKCTEHTARQLAHVYADVETAPPLEMVQNPMILNFLIDALFNPSSTGTTTTTTSSGASSIGHAVSSTNHSVNRQKKKNPNETPSDFIGHVIHILTFITCGQDLSKGTSKTNHNIQLFQFDHVREMLAKASAICKSDHTLGFNMSQSSVVFDLSQLMQVPVVSMGVLHWIVQASHSPTFHNSSLFLACFPSFLKLIRVAVDTHMPFQWPTCFQLLVDFLELKPDLNNPVKALDLKRDVLRSMVHLMTRGYVLPVLRYVIAQTAALDQALLRNFVSFVMARISGPFSPGFSTCWIQLLMHPKVQNALRVTCPADTRKELVAFGRSCAALAQEGTLRPSIHLAFQNVLKLFGG